MSGRRVFMLDITHQGMAPSLWGQFLTFSCGDRLVGLFGSEKNDDW